ncbi:MAG: DNA polymerase III subunit beta [Desulfobulbaceae bacterium]|nr:MAG: DNA polymerase III subunit beta [Desulfobulbaceae bacterium]
MTLALNVSRLDLLAALALLQNVAAKKGTMAILANILLETDQDGLLLTATDLEIGIRCRVPAEILSPGAITLPAKKLFEVIKETEENQINLSEYENFWIKISSKNSDCRMAGIEADEFPEFPDYSEHKMVGISSLLLRSLLDKTTYAIAQEGESTFNLTGLLLEKEIMADDHVLRAVSSNGHRLALMEKRSEEDLSDLVMDRVILIPKKGVQELRKLCDEAEKVFLGIEEKQIVFKAGSFILVIRLMSDDFPNYKSIVHSVNETNCLEVERKKLMNSLRRVNIFADDRFSAVSFVMASNNMTISSQSMDYGSAKEEIPIVYNGDPLEVGFNGRYFYESIQLMASENIKICINKKSPCFIKGDDDRGYLSMIMPMKL